MLDNLVLSLDFIVSDIYRIYPVSYTHLSQSQMQWIHPEHIHLVPSTLTSQRKYHHSLPPDHLSLIHICSVESNLCRIFFFVRSISIASFGAFTFLNKLTTSSAVSYTHLDVYKRQGNSYSLLLSTR